MRKTDDMPDFIWGPMLTTLRLIRRYSEGEGGGHAAAATADDGAATHDEGAAAAGAAVFLGGRILAPSSSSAVEARAVGFWQQMNAEHLLAKAVSAQRPKHLRRAAFWHWRLGACTSGILGLSATFPARVVFTLK